LGFFESGGEIVRRNNYNYIISASYGVVHALIDCACAMSIFWGIRHVLRYNDFVFWIVTYNLIAFVLQPLIGVCLDKYKKYRVFAIVGCVLVIIGAFITSSRWVSIIVFALGNALFHVAAGSVCLTLHKGKTVYAGIFVAPGDVGLVVGTLIGTNFIKSPIIIAIVAISILIAVLFISIIENKYKQFEKHEKHEENEKHEEYETAGCIGGNGNLPGLAILLLCIVIAVRAFIGSALSFTWVEGAVLAVILSVFITAGKAAGGILADRLGRKTIGVSALLISAPLLAFFHSNIVASLIGIFIFNMTMPLTMTAIYDKMPEYPAFSFGIAAMALIPGFYAGGGVDINAAVLLSVIIAAAIILYISLSLSKRGGGVEVE